MIFEFERKRICNKDRFYPNNEHADILMELAKRAVLLKHEIEHLQKHGWNIRII
jgi:hypothetical protein